MISNVNILGLYYEVKEVPVVSKNEMLLGEINYIDQIIRIDESLSTEKKEIVLMHEILHGND